MIKSLISNTEDQSNPCLTRNYNVVEIRRSTREETFQKKRTIQSIYSQQVAIALLQPTIIDQRFREHMKQIYLQTFEEEQIPQLFEHTYNNDVRVVLRSAVGLRKIINREHDVINIMNEEGRVQAIARLLRFNDYPQIILEATWCVANIASVPQFDVMKLKNSGVVAAIIDLMNQPECNITIFQHAIIAISNIAVEKYELRDQIIKAGCIERIISTLMQKPEMPDETLQNLCWTLANLCRGSPLPDYTTIQVAVKYLACLISQNNPITDPEVLTDCIFALVHNIGLKNNNQELLVQIQAVKKLLSLCLNNQNNRQVIACLRIMGNLAAGSDQIVEHLISNNIIQTLAHTITHPKKTIRYQTCWILSNIAATNPQYALSILVFPGLLQNLYKCAEDSCDNVRKEVCFVFANIVLRLKPSESFQFLINGRALELICSMLTCQSSKTLKGILQCLSNIFKSYMGVESESNYFDILSECFSMHQGPQKLQALTFHKNEKIRTQVNKFITAYIDVREDKTLASQNYKRQIEEQTRTEEENLLLEQFRRELLSKTIPTVTNDHS